MKKIVFSGLWLLLVMAMPLPAWSIAALERVEPAFWWVGMKNPQLQLMVYGADIAGATPEINHPDIRLERVIRVENANYVFLDLLLTDNRRATEFDIIFRRGKKVAASYRYRLLERAPGSALRESYTPADAIYLITPDRFVNGNPANDESPQTLEKIDRKNPGGRHGGDIEGVVNSLDYIRDMGFTAIWLNPLLENNQDSFSYHGYSITDFYKTDPRFGTNEDYLRLCRLAGEKGIKVIVDMVMNHCGSGHWWVKDLPSSDWFNFNNQFVPTNHARTTVQDPYASEWDNRSFVDGWFVTTMPDLNQRNPLMANYLIQNTIWWLEYAQFAGIRMDTYPYPDKDFMAQWTCRLLEEYPNLNIVGEEWTENPALIAHWQRGKQNAGGYVSCLPSVMDFPIQGALSKALTEPEAYGKGWVRLYEMLANDFLYPDPYNLVIFPDNHDMSRIFTQVNEDYELFKLGMAYLLTLRGIPQIFYGTEVLMGNPGTDSHGVIRSDFPGGWPGDGANAFTCQGLSNQQRDAQAFLKKLLNWRKNQAVVHSGRLKHFAPEKGVYVLCRYNDEKTVLTILNKTADDQTLDAARFAEVLQGATRGRDVISGKVFDLGAGIAAPARSALILELEKR